MLMNPGQSIDINFANADMLGHTNSGSAAEASVLAIDQCLAAIVP